PSVILAVRLTFVGFALVPKEVLPDPVPAVTPVTVSHAPDVDEVQAHRLSLAVNVIVPASPSSGLKCDEGLTLNAHAAPCVTLTVCPATVTDPERVVESGFAVAVTVALPFPNPVAPLVTVSHDVLVDAVHVQLAVV